MSLKKVELKPKITVKPDSKPQIQKETPDEVVITVNDLLQPTINKTIITMTKQPFVTPTQSISSIQPARILMPENSVEQNDHDDEEYDLEDEDLENYEYDEDMEEEDNYEDNE